MSIIKGLIITAGVGVAALLVAKKLYAAIPTPDQGPKRNSYGRPCETIPATLNKAYTTWAKKSGLAELNDGLINGKTQAQIKAEYAARTAIPNVPRAPWGIAPSAPVDYVDQPVQYASVTATNRSTGQRETHVVPYCPAYTKKRGGDCNAPWHMFRDTPAGRFNGPSIEITPWAGGMQTLMACDTSKPLVCSRRADGVYLKGLDEQDQIGMDRLCGLEYLGKKKKAKAPKPAPPEYLCPAEFILVPGTRSCMPIGCGVEG